MWFAHAVILLAAAPESPAGPVGAVVHRSDHVARREPPTEALDMHTLPRTRRGRGDGALHGRGQPQLEEFTGSLD